MGYNQEIADKILEYAKQAPSVLDDFRQDDFDADDFRDTAKRLISSGRIFAKLKEDYSSPYLDFRK